MRVECTARATTSIPRPGNDVYTGHAVADYPPLDAAGAAEVSDTNGWFVGRGLRVDGRFAGMGEGQEDQAESQA
jgi:hypothetical protein